MDFDEIFEEYWQKVLRLCMGYVNNHDLANDLAQETFIKVWQHLPKFRNESSVGTWIFRIATNYCIRQIKSDKTVKQINPPNLLDDADDNHEVENNTKLLYQYISELPEVDRLIISLELEDLDQSEIASIVGMSNTNVRVRIHRIKKKIGDKFKKK